MIYKELESNFEPFKSLPLIPGGELEWAIKNKMPASEKNKGLANVFKYDHENRLAIKLALETRLASLPNNNVSIIQLAITKGIEDKAADLVYKQHL